MHKVVLIDDEPLVIEGLTSLVDWNSYGFKVAGFAEDGESGFDLIQTLEPDLVITDVRMPAMDGLSLIKKCQQQISKEIRFAILSGFNEFEYVKEALSLKSMSYMLKPIDADEIHPLLTSIKADIDRSNEATEKFSQSLGLVRRNTFLRLLEGDLKPSLISRMKFLLNASETTRYLYVEASDQSSHYLLSPYPHLDLIQIKEPHRVRALVFGQEGPVNDFYQSNLDGLRISKPFLKLEEIKEIVDKMERQSKIAFYEGPSDSNKTTRDKDCSDNRHAFDRKKILKLLGTATEEMLAFEIFAMLRKVRQVMLDEALLHHGYLQLLSEIENTYHITLTPIPYKFFNDFKEAFTSQMLGVAERLHEDSPLTIVHKVKEHIDQTYSGDLRLKVTADGFGYNSVYLGQLFQKVTQIKYNDYVMNVRMAKAKELLLYSNLKIKEVAYQVGFNNPDYFVQKFKEAEGLSPSEYRR